MFAGLSVVGEWPQNRNFKLSLELIIRVTLIVMATDVTFIVPEFRIYLDKFSK
jgi:hypothetical protein